MKKVFAFILMLVLPVALAAQNTTIDPNHDQSRNHRQARESLDIPVCHRSAFAILQY
jgi:hypothetical protein